MGTIEHNIVFYLFGKVPIRDTIIMTLILDVIIILAVLLIRKAIPSLLETLIEFVTSLVDEILDVDNLNPYIPIIGSLFMFLLTANMLSIVPVLKSPTADINTTLALALTIFFTVHVYGVMKKGFWKYLITIADPIFLLPLELISQLSRTLSLTLRLFGNIVSGDIIVALVFSIVPMIAPIPFIGLSIFSGVLQAYIMSVLATLYIAFAVEVNQEKEGRQNGGFFQNLFNRKERTHGES